MIETRETPEGVQVIVFDYIIATCLAPEDAERLSYAAKRLLPRILRCSAADLACHAGIRPDAVLGDDVETPLCELLGPVESKAFRKAMEAA